MAGKNKLENKLFPNYQQKDDEMESSKIVPEPTSPPEESEDVSLQLMGRAPAPGSLEPETQPPVSQMGGEYPKSDFGQPMGIPQEMPSRIMEEQIEQIAEAIIGEKWDKLTKNVGDLVSWREHVQLEVDSVKQETLRVNERIENLQSAVIGKVSEYNKTLTEVNSEMQALSKVFEKILQPLTTNIKDLARITKELKSKK